MLKLTHEKDIIYVHNGTQKLGTWSQREMKAERLRATGLLRNRIGYWVVSV